jgi:hypothetical protein
VPRARDALTGRILRSNVREGATHRFTNGDQSTAGCPLGDAGITCRVIDASMISQMKALEEENRRLKKMYAEMSMQAELLKEALGKK